MARSRASYTNSFGLLRFIEGHDDRRIQRGNRNPFLNISACGVILAAATVTTTSSVKALLDAQQLLEIYKRRLTSTASTRGQLDCFRPRRACPFHDDQQAETPQTCLPSRLQGTWTPPRSRESEYPSRTRGSQRRPISPALRGTSRRLHKNSQHLPDRPQF